MCTLTYVPLWEDSANFILMDNRDEAVNRPAAFPQVYEELGTRLFYPKDKRAGGTWFGVSQQNRAMALLNGAFKPHKRKAAYRKSRGVVVKELLAVPNLEEGIENYDFKDIEAFFGIIFSWGKEHKIMEVVWDGSRLFLDEKDAGKPHIWSSAMTFSPEQHRQKELHFESFIQKNHASEALPDLLWEFHQYKEGDAAMILDFGFLKTTSISQLMHLGEEGDFFRFKDLITGESQEDEITWE